MPKFSTKKKGFTLIELMVVMSIMVILISVMVINLNSQKAARDIKIAQNQLVSDLRKTAAYTLASRITPSGQTALYYLVKFDLNNPTKYFVQAITKNSNNYQLENVETIGLPSGISIASTSAASYPIVVSQRIANPATQNFLSTDCGLVAFVAPFGKTIVNKGCNIPAAPAVSISNTADDYGKIVNFQTNVACDTNSNPPSCSASTDSLFTITLRDQKNTVSKTVTVNAVTGAIIFN
ncbi:MAG: type II secretion system protein [Candidatus Doudnabacteria bacterium]|nr:type II secretion system protein [Candidatus Doudnabacteria bacterium]